MRFFVIVNKEIDRVYIFTTKDVYKEKYLLSIEKLIIFRNILNHNSLEEFINFLKEDINQYTQ